MKEIFILQMHTGTIPGKIVKMFTKYEYSHVVLSLNNELNKLYSFGRKDISNPLNGGFIVEDIDGEFFNKFNKTKCRIYKLSVTEEQFNSLQKILKFFEDKQDEYKYDFLGLVLRCFSIPLKREKYYVCSQFVAEVLTNANIHEFSKPSQFIKPKDFENISEEIYTGLLSDAKRVVR